MCTKKYIQKIFVAVTLLRRMHMTYNELNQKKHVIGMPNFTKREKKNKETCLLALMGNIIFGSRKLLHKFVVLMNVCQIHMHFFNVC